MPDGILKLGSWCILGLLQNGYLEIDHAKWFLIFQTAQGPSELFLVYKLGLKKWLKRAFENHFDEKNKINPVLTNFQHLFCNEKAYPRPGTL